ncbi:unnamed protein product, partial [Staurois parvus]
RLPYFSHHKTYLDFRGGKQEKKILNQWTADIVQEMTRGCGHSIGDGETADIVQEMTRDCRHSTGDDQRLQT